MSVYTGPRHGGKGGGATERGADADGSRTTCRCSMVPNAPHRPTRSRSQAGHSMCVVQTSTQPRSIRALPTMTLSIISCIRYPLAGLTIKLVLSADTRFDPDQSRHHPDQTHLQPAGRVDPTPGVHGCNLPCSNHHSPAAVPHPPYRPRSAPACVALRGRTPNVLISGRSWSSTRYAVPGGLEAH
jgi:hypothetical protein